MPQEAAVKTQCQCQQVLQVQPKIQLQGKITYTTIAAKTRRLRGKLTRYEKRYEISTERLVREFDNDEIRPTREIIEWYHSHYSLKSLNERIAANGTPPPAAGSPTDAADDTIGATQPCYGAEREAAVKTQCLCPCCQVLQVQPKIQLQGKVTHTTPQAERRRLRRKLKRYEKRYAISTEQLVREFDNDEIRPTREIVDWYLSYYALKSLLEWMSTNGTPSTATASSMKPASANTPS